MKTHTMAALCGIGIGYVLGARAGRERYEQIRRNARRVADHPQVRAAGHLAQEKVEERAPDVKDRVAAAAGKVRPDHNGQGATGWPPDPRTSAREPTPTYPRMHD